MTTKQFVHGAGLVTAAVLGTLSQFPAAVQSPYMRAALGALAVLSALFTNLDKLGGAAPPALLLLLALPLLHGCAWLQKPSTQKVVRCTGDVASQCASDAVSAALACLSAPLNPMPCLLALVSPAMCATRDALSCAVREAEKPPSPPAGLRALLASPVSPDPIVAAHARRFYDETGLVPVGP